MYTCKKNGWTYVLKWAYKFIKFVYLKELDNNVYNMATSV